MDQHKEELTRYAENNVINQELQRKLANSQQFEKQIKENEELIRKLEFDLRERKNVTETLTADNAKAVSYYFVFVNSVCLEISIGGTPCRVA